MVALIYFIAQKNRKSLEQARTKMKNELQVLATLNSMFHVPPQVDAQTQGADVQEPPTKKRKIDSIDLTQQE